MSTPERPLRVLLVSGVVHDEFTISAPYFAEITNKAGREFVCGFNTATADCFFCHSSHDRKRTLASWRALTNEELTAELKPIAAEGGAS